MKRITFLALGILCSMCFSVAQNEQWMAGLNDNIFIAQMSLPGAHNAATSSLSSIGKCQNKNLSELWDAGVRVFDLRPTDNGNDCTIYHGSLLSTGVTFREALSTITGKLYANTSEFAVILMRKEDGDADTWKTKVSAIVNSIS